MCRSRADSSGQIHCGIPHKVRACVVVLNMPLFKSKEYEKASWDDMRLILGVSCHGYVVVEVSTWLKKRIKRDKREYIGELK